MQSNLSSLNLILRCSEMDNGDIESAKEEFQGQRRRKYHPVEAHDRAVLEMSSMDHCKKVALFRPLFIKDY